MIDRLRLDDDITAQVRNLTDKVNELVDAHNRLLTQLGQSPFGRRCYRCDTLALCSERCPRGWSNDHGVLLCEDCS